MKAVFALLLVLAILLYSVQATCKDDDGKDYPQGCQRCRLGKCRPDLKLEYAT